METDLAVRAPAPAQRGGLGTRAHRARPRRRQDVRAQGRGLGVAVSGRAPGHVGARPNGNAPVPTVARARAGLEDPLETYEVDFLRPITRHSRPKAHRSF